MEHAKYMTIPEIMALISTNLSKLEIAVTEEKFADIRLVFVDEDDVNFIYDDVEYCIDVYAGTIEEVKDDDESDWDGCMITESEFTPEDAEVILSQVKRHASSAYGVENPPRPPRRVSECKCDVILMSLDAIKGVLIHLLETEGVSVTPENIETLKLIEIDLEEEVECGTLVFDDRMYNFDLEEGVLKLVDPEDEYPIYDEDDEDEDYDEDEPSSLFPRAMPCPKCGQPNIVTAEMFADFQYECSNCGHGTKPCV